MTRVNRHAAMLDYLSACPLINDLFFNFAEGYNGATEVVTSEQSRAVCEYTDGGKLIAYDFTVIRFEGADTLPNSPANAEIIYGVEQIMAWLDECGHSGIFPNFGDLHVQSVRALQEVPTVCGWDDNGAKYQFAVRVTYYEPAHIY